MTRWNYTPVIWRAERAYARRAPWPSAPTTSTPSRRGRASPSVLARAGGGARSCPPRRRRRRHRPRAEPPAAPRRPPGPAAPASARSPARSRRRWPTRLPGPLWSHQAEAIDLARCGPVGGGRLGHGLGQVALLPGADRRGGGRADPAGHRRSSCSPPRPWPTISCGRSPRSSCRASSPAPTTVTPARRSAPGCASTRRSCSRTPRCSTPGSCRTTSAGPRSSAGCATSWSTSSTPSGACSAATSPSCCAGSAAWRSTTAPTRSSSAPRPPSASPSGWPRRVCGVDVVAGARRRLAPRTAHGRPLAAPAARRGAQARGRRPTARRRPSWPGSSTAGSTTLGLRPQPARGRDRRRRRAASPASARSAARVRAYRGGYLAEERRAIEDELFAGQLVGGGRHLRPRARASTSAGSTPS